jgi:TRAP transporter TAXI family solute receptor
VVHDAVAGTGRWRGRRAQELRSVLALYPEVMTVLAGSAAGIAELADLAGKRVNIGSRGTGSRAAWDVLEQALGWSRADLAVALELRPAAADEALCTGAIDASVQVLGQPSARVADLLARCPVRLVGVAGPAVEALTAQRPYLQKASIPGELFGAIGDTPTYGGMAVVMATRRTPDRVVAAVVGAVAEHLEELRVRFPILRDAELPTMLAAAGKSAPPHPGVAMALQRRGPSQ